MNEKNRNKIEHMRQIEGKNFLRNFKIYFNHEHFCQRCDTKVREWWIFIWFIEHWALANSIKKFQHDEDPQNLNLTNSTDRAKTSRNQLWRLLAFEPIVSQTNYAKLWKAEASRIPKQRLCGSFCVLRNYQARSFN